MERIDLAYWKRCGGNPAKPPYMDVAGGTDPYNQAAAPRVRVFVSALWYSTWETWRAAADLAVEVALQGVNPIVVERGITIGTAAELDPQPSYIFDRSLQRYKTLSILLNAAAITDEAKYDAVLITAEAKRRVVEKGLLKKGGDPGEYTKYNIVENGRRYVADDLADNEAEQNRNLSRLFRDGDPAEERREALIRELMRLDMEARE